MWNYFPCNKSRRDLLTVKRSCGRLHQPLEVSSRLLLDEARNRKSSARLETRRLSLYSHSEANSSSSISSSYQRKYLLLKQKYCIFYNFFCQSWEPLILWETYAWEWFKQFAMWCSVCVLYTVFKLVCIHIYCFIDWKCLCGYFLNECVCSWSVNGIHTAITLG